MMRHVRSVGLNIGVCVIVAAACGRVARPVSQQDSAFEVSQNTAPAAVDSRRALDLDRYLTPQVVAERGTCIATGAPPSRSRLVYVLAPDSLIYVRLNVGTSGDGSQPEMIDLARGIGGSRIWYATLERGSHVVTTRTFMSQGDKNPTTLEVALGGAEGQQLLRLARAALQLPCTR